MRDHPGAGLIALIALIALICIAIGGMLYEFALASRFPPHTPPICRQAAYDRVTFGMTLGQVIQLLGQPDRVLTAPAPSAVTSAAGMRAGSAPAMAPAEPPLLTESMFWRESGGSAQIHVRFDEGGLVSWKDCGY